MSFPRARRALCGLLLTGAALVPVSLSGQAGSKPAPGPPHGTIRGFVYDSVHAAPLIGAVILVDGASPIGMTGPDGQFLVDSIPPGTRRIHVMHPVLDTIGLSIATDEFTVRAGDTLGFSLAVPSGRQIITRICPPGQIARGPGALIGQVSDPDTDKPAVGSRVQLLYDAPAPLGIGKATPTIRETNTDSLGSYRICGLPSPLVAKVQVFRNDVSSGQAEVRIGEGLLALRSLAVVSARATKTVVDSSGAQKQVTIGRAKLTGKVINKAGQPVERARVAVAGTGAIAITNSRGEFTLDSLPAGTQSVEVRKLGYGMTEKSVELAAATPAKVSVIMGDVELPAMVVEAERNNALETLGYNERKKRGFGFFLDGSKLNNNASAFAEMLRAAPMLRFNPNSRGQQVIQDARDPNMGCVVYYVDGQAWKENTPGDINDYLSPDEVRAVEVYNPSSVPSRFTQSGYSKCATVVVWTIRSTNRPNRRK